MGRQRQLPVYDNTEVASGVRDGDASCSSIYVPLSSERSSSSPPSPVFMPDGPAAPVAPFRPGTPSQHTEKTDTTDNWCRQDTSLTDVQHHAYAQYAELEANAKVNGRDPFLLPHLSETPQPISMSCQIYYYVPLRELMCKIWLDSIRPLRICACVKKHVLCGFFINEETDRQTDRYLSVCPFLRRGYSSQFGGDVNA